MPRIEISVPRQTLRLLADDGHVLREYSVSTSRYGVGEQNGSNRTPRGRHGGENIGGGSGIGSLLAFDRGRFQGSTGTLFEPARPRRRQPVGSAPRRVGCDPGRVPGRT